MFSDIEVKLVFDAEHFSISSLFSHAPSALESNTHRIVDSNTWAEIGKVIFTPKEASKEKESDFQNLKSSLKRLYASVHPSPTKRTSNVPKAPKIATGLRNSTQVGSNASPMIQQSSAKIDVTSMMAVVQQMGSTEKSYKCSFCGQESAHVTSMRRHIEKIHLPNSTSFDCMSCEYKTKHKFVLKNHYMNKHGMPEPAALAMMVNY